jgi:transposase
MFYVGVDVAKETHYACVTYERISVLVPPFAFANDEIGFAKFMRNFAKHPKDEVIVGLEATGIYGDNLIARLFDYGYKIALINPIETAEVRKKKIRNAKTDKIDTRNICKYLETEKYRLLQPKELQTMRLRGLCLFRQTLKKSKARLKTQLVSYLDLIFPEFAKAFDSVHLKGACAVLCEFPTAINVARENVIRLTNILRAASRGKFGREKAELVKVLAKSSITSPTTDMSFQIKNTIEQIRLIESQLKTLKIKFVQCLTRSAPLSPPFPESERLTAR